MVSSAEFQQRMQRTQSLRRQLERVLHTAGVGTFAEDFDSYVDNLMTRACHAKPLPCDRRGGGDGECLTLGDARAVLDEGDWQYGFLYRDEVRGREVPVTWLRDYPRYRPGPPTCPESSCRNAQSKGVPASPELWPCP